MKMMQLVQIEFDFGNGKPENEGGLSPHSQLVSTHCSEERAASSSICVINLGSAAPAKSGPLSWSAKIASARARVSRACAPLADRQSALQGEREARRGGNPPRRIPLISRFNAFNKLGDLLSFCTVRWSDSVTAARWLIREFKENEDDTSFAARFEGRDLDSAEMD